MQQSFRLIVSALVLVFATVQAQAHPHVWIIARTEMLSDAEGRLLALRHTWTFDPAYSAFAVMGLDKDGDGKPDPNELGKMAATNVGSLQEFGYFTAAKVNGQKAELGHAENYTASYDNSRVTLRFVLPLKVPVKPKVVALQIDDPSFFVAFTLDRATDAVKLVGLATACVVNIKRPAKEASEGVQILADQIANALKGQLGEGSTLTADYKGSVLVACP